MANYFYEKQSDGSLLLLNLMGEYQGPDFPFSALQVSFIGDPLPPTTPLPPVIDGVLSVMNSRTQATIVWTAPNNTGRPPITDYRIYRSDDGGAEFLLGNTGSPSILTYVDSGLPTNTPEKIFSYSIRALNADGLGAESSVKNLQYAGAPQSPPAPATTLQRGTLTESSVILTWDFPADTTVDKQAIYNGSTLLVDNIDKVAKAFTWSGLVPGTSYSSINIKRHNSSPTNGGWSAQSNTVAFVVPNGSAPAFYGHQVGLTYVGMSTDVSFSQAITEIGSEVDAYRIFDPQSSSIGTCFTRAHKMVPWVSAKPASFGVTSGTDIAMWNSIASGSQDAQIRSLADSLLAYVQGANKPPMAFTFNHEPIAQDRTATAGTAYTAAFSRIIDVFKSRPTWNDRILFAPNYEEFTFRLGATPVWSAWCNSAFMDRIDFFSFDAYQFASTNTNNAAALRIGRIKTMLQGVGYPNIPLGIGEMGGRQDTTGYPIDNTRWTSAQYGRNWVNYLKADPQFWLVSFYNAVDVGNARLTQPPYIPPDTETYMDVYRDYLSQGARLSTIGIT